MLRIAPQDEVHTLCASGMTMGERTYYEATAEPLSEFPTLEGSVRADMCVIGAGFTGIGAALSLAEAGYSVVVLEQGRVASGASGRNGGQIHTGLRKDQIYLERAYGTAAARQLWDIGQDAVTEIGRRMARHEIHAERVHGLIYADHRAGLADKTSLYVDHLHTHYAYDKVERLDSAAIRALVRSDDYKGGMIDRGGGHLHPLKYARGLTRAAESAGARFFENTKALSITPGAKARVTTPSGEVVADWILVAGDSLMQGLVAEADARIMSIASTVGVTAPLGEGLKHYLATPMAVADSRFVVNYFRPTADGRLLFGGGESYSTTYVADPAAKVRRALETVFPDLAETDFDFAWSGVVGVTATRLPMVRRLYPNVLMAAGYSGQGVALAPFAGKVMAEAIMGTTEKFDILARLPVPAFPGGAALRQPLLVLAMLWYALRDRL